MGEQDEGFGHEVWRRKGGGDWVEPTVLLLIGAGALCTGPVGWILGVIFLLGGGATLLGLTRRHRTFRGVLLERYYDRPEPPDGTWIPMATFRAGSEERSFQLTAELHAALREGATYEITHDGNDEIVSVRGVG